MAKKSAWTKGVEMYARELLEDFRQYSDGARLTERALLNGASDWNEYSYGGCALIFDGDIAARLCNPTEYKRTDGGRRAPNGRENWLDVQARALYQAARLVLSGEIC